MTSCCVAHDLPQFVKDVGITEMVPWLKNTNKISLKKKKKKKFRGKIFPGFSKLHKCVAL